MKNILRFAIIVIAVFAASSAAMAQESGSSARMRRGGRDQQQQQTNSEITSRMQGRLQTLPTSDAEMSWMKVIYRALDLNKKENAPLYFPEMPVDGNESLFRLIIRLLANGQLPVYEYLDGREAFDEEHRVKARDIFDRHHIYYTEGRGNTERNPKFEVHESDVPAMDVLTYYIIERWEFDTRTNRLRSRVEAICPVLHRSEDYGMEAMRYPMFWVKYDDLRPYLSTQNIFVSDSNNLPSCTYDDYFQLAMYSGDIYKTRNLRNRSMKQLYPDPDALKHAQDSIEQELAQFEKKLWVPSLEELEARSAAKEGKAAKGKKAKAEQAEQAAPDTDEAVESAEATDEQPKVTNNRRSSKKKSNPVKVKRQKSKTKEVKSSSSSAPARSVRNRKR